MRRDGQVSRTQINTRRAEAIRDALAALLRVRNISIIAPRRRRGKQILCHQ